MELYDPSKPLNLGRIKTLDGKIKKNSPQTLIKAPPLHAQLATDSGININFCPVVNPKIFPQFNPPYNKNRN
jgi:hypothetical protein